MHDSTLHDFAKRYFRTVPIMLGRDSLETFLGISHHEIFARAVRDVEITSDRLSLGHYWECVEASSPRYRQYDLCCASGVVAHPRRRKYKNTTFDNDVYLEYLDQQEALVQGGLGIEALSQAMMRLPNLRKISLSDEHYPYGAPCLIRKIGVRPKRGLQGRLIDQGNLVKDLWRIALQAACRTQVREIDVNLRCDRSWSHIATAVPSMLHLPNNEQDLICQNFMCLTTLSLLVSPQEVNNWHASDLLPILSSFRHLTHFGLHFAEFEDNDILQPVSRELEIKDLEVLELSFLTVSAASLIPLLVRHHRTLKKVLLRRVSVAVPDDWPLLFATMRDQLPACSMTLERCMYIEKKLCPEAQMLTMATGEDYDEGIALIKKDIERINGLRDVSFLRFVSLEEIWKVLFRHPIIWNDEEHANQEEHSRPGVTV